MRPHAGQLVSTMECAAPYRYLRIGWNWIRSALSQGWELLTRFRLNGEPDPQPARASNNQYVRDPGPAFKVKFINYARP